MTYLSTYSQAMLFCALSTRQKKHSLPTKKDNQFIKLKTPASTTHRLKLMGWLRNIVSIKQRYLLREAVATGLSTLFWKHRYGIWSNISLETGSKHFVQARFFLSLLKLLLTLVYVVCWFCLQFILDRSSIFQEKCSKT